MYRLSWYSESILETESLSCQKKDATLSLSLLSNNLYEQQRSQLYTNAALSAKRQHFTVTNEQHPLHGKSYCVTNFSKSFGVALVQYTDENGLEKSINIAFTSLSIIHPFISINNGRCDFVFDDLLDLLREIDMIKQGAV
jgi:hypothetical protein